MVALEIMIVKLIEIINALNLRPAIKYFFIVFSFFVDYNSSDKHDNDVSNRHYSIKITRQELSSLKIKRLLQPFGWQGSKLIIDSSDLAAEGHYLFSRQVSWLIDRHYLAPSHSKRWLCAKYSLLTVAGPRQIQTSFPILHLWRHLYKFMFPFSSVSQANELTTIQRMFFFDSKILRRVLHVFVIIQ